MPGLVPGIHVLTKLQQQDVDGRVKPGHDECGLSPQSVITIGSG
jgi:zinc D-Ala-D-Ala dipeptidase